MDNKTFRMIVEIPDQSEATASWLDITTPANAVRALDFVFKGAGFEGVRVSVASPEPAEG